MDIKSSNLKDFASTALKTALQKGADEAEVYISISDNLSIEVLNQSIETIEKSITFGYGIRIIKDKRLGFSFSSTVDNYKEVIENAIALSTYCEPDEAYCLSPSSELNAVKVFDNKTASVSEVEALECALRVERSAMGFDSRIANVRSPIASFARKQTIIANTNDVLVGTSSTLCSASVIAVAKSASDSQSAWSFGSSRKLDNVDFEAVGKEASKRAISLLDARRVNSFKGQIVLDSLIACEFLALFAHALSAEAMLKKRSFLTDKLGQAVASQFIDIIDDGSIDYLAGSRQFDAEGFAVSKKTLIQNGILQGFMHNSYTARKSNTISTGNAVRGGYAGTPSVGPSNLYISPSETARTVTFDELINAVNKGIYVIETMGMHTANVVSGEYSIGISGIMIENGKLGYPVKEAVISGNILDMFKNIELLSDKVVFYGSSGSPALLVNNVDISG